MIFDLICSEMRERKWLESFDSALDVKRAKNLPILADFSWLYRHTIQLTCVGPLSWFMLFTTLQEQIGLRA